MLDEFLAAHRDVIIERTRGRVARRSTPPATAIEIDTGIPVFLDQLVEALRLARSTSVIDHEAISRSAAKHGLDLLRRGLTVGQVVHDYGDVCQTVTELAIEEHTPLSSEEFQILNLCLDDAIAEAVTEYARHRERTITDEGTERLGVLAHELRNRLNTAMLSFESLKEGRVGPSGSTGRLLGRSLLGLRDLIDRSLADVRLEAGLQKMAPLSVAEFIEDVEIGGHLQAEARRQQFTVTSVDRAVTVEADRQILAGAVSNLLQNAFKFTRLGGHVRLTVHAKADRVLFEVEDECGGLPPGRAEELFQAYEQRGADVSGVGLGLSICLKAARANGGNIYVRDIPGTGCVFTIDLPRS
jgi:signal transduction histidine kinase